MAALTRRIAHFLLLAAAALTLASCATLTRMAYSNAAFAYTNLPPMLAWLVDDYVDLQGNQKDWVRDRIDRAMHWHRVQELPAYGRFITHVLEESTEPFTVAEVAQAFGELQVRYHRTVEQVLPDIADFLLQLDSGQIAQLERKFADDNKKLVKESGQGNAEQRRERRVKKFVEHIESWVGPISAEQRELIDRHYVEIPDLLEERLADRRYRHEQTLALVRAKPPKEQVVATLRKLLIDTESWRRADYTRKMKERDQHMFQMFSALSGTLTAEQRQRMQSRLKRYLRDIQTLTASTTRTGG